MSALDTQTRAHEHANNAWQQWQAEHAVAATYPPDMLLELHEAFSAGFLRGARWSFAESAKLAPAIATLDDFLHWLRDQ